MEREVWKQIVAQVDKFAKPASRRFRFPPREIVLVYVWAALHDRPIYWACRAGNWPAELRPRRLPSQPTMSRRLRVESVGRLLKAVERRARIRAARSLVHIVDGKPLSIARHSRDRDARFGRGAGGLNKGYKLHVIVSRTGDLAAWCVRPANEDEAKTAAAYLLDQKPLTGYLLADANYDRNALYGACRERGIQLLAPRRYGSNCGLGHCRHDPARLYAIEQQERLLTGFATQLMQERRRVEPWLGALSASSFGLTHLPPWVRRHRRVQQWICAKLIVAHCAKRARKHAS